MRRCYRALVAPCLAAKWPLLCGSGNAKKALAQPQHSIHAITAGFGRHHPCRRTHGTAGEGLARRGLVGDFQTLAVAGEQYGLFADDIAAANALEADGLALAGAGMALAR